MALTRIGIVTGLARSPIKGMHMEELRSVVVNKYGLEHDRVAGIRHCDLLRNVLPNSMKFLTMRKVPEMVRFEATLADDMQWYVRVPDGESTHTFALNDPEFLEFIDRKYKIHNLRIEYNDERIHDSRAVTLISSQSLKAVSLEQSSAYSRFRMNLCADLQGKFAHQFEEDKMVGRIVQIGNHVRIHFTKKIPRCIVVNVDPKSASTSPHHLKEVGKLNRGTLGIGGVVLAIGSIKIQDTIYLED